MTKVAQKETYEVHFGAKIQKTNLGSLVPLSSTLIASEKYFGTVCPLFILSINPVILAVLCGNSVVVKPSEVTPMSGALVQEIFALAEAPEHLVQTVIGDGETGADTAEQDPPKATLLMAAVSASCL